MVRKSKTRRSGPLRLVAVTTTLWVASFLARSPCCWRQPWNRRSLHDHAGETGEKEESGISFSMPLSLLSCSSTSKRNRASRIAGGTCNRNRGFAVDSRVGGSVGRRARERAVERGDEGTIQVTPRVQDYISLTTQSGIPWVALVGESEMRDGTLKLKSIIARQEEEFPRKDFAQKLGKTVLSHIYLLWRHPMRYLVSSADYDEGMPALTIRSCRHAMHAVAATMFCFLGADHVDTLHHSFALSTETSQTAKQKFTGFATP